MEWTKDYVNVKVYRDDPTVGPTVLVSDETIREDVDAGQIGEREQIPDIWHRLGLQLDAFYDPPITQEVKMYVDYARVYTYNP